MIQFQHVSYQYPRQDSPAIHDISFSIQPGEFVGILGANDSGKTTIAKLCNGLLLPADGDVSVNGQCVGRDIDVHQVRRRIGVVFSDPENQIVGTTVEEDIAFGLGNLCVPPVEMRRRIDAVLDRVGLREYALREPHCLSGGEQQKLCLASVLAMQPECLVLDAPLTFLDSASRAEILAFVSALHADGGTVIYCTSDPEELIKADRILLLNNGLIANEYTSATLKQNPALLEQVGIMPPVLWYLDASLGKGAVEHRHHSSIPHSQGMPPCADVGPGW